MRYVLVLSFLAALQPLSGQAVIDPGMPKTQVIARLGAPALERTTGDATYLFYKNGCERTCGMNDVVLLDKGAVVDAVFRSDKRRYSGSSSSPRAIPAREAMKAKATKPPAGDAADANAPLTLSITGKKPAAATPAKPQQKPQS